MNTVTASFNKTVRQTTEIFQWPKCLSEKGRYHVCVKNFCTQTRWKSQHRVV